MHGALDLADSSGKQEVVNPWRNHISCNGCPLPSKAFAPSTTVLLYRYRAGIPWRDLPERFGNFRAIHLRHMRWSRRGVWKHVFEILAADADGQYAMIDPTIVRALKKRQSTNRPGCWPQPGRGKFLLRYTSGRAHPDVEVRHAGQRSIRMSS